MVEDGDRSEDSKLQELAGGSGSQPLNKQFVFESPEKDVDLESRPDQLQERSISDKLRDYRAETGLDNDRLMGSQQRTQAFSFVGYKDIK